MKSSQLKMVLAAMIVALIATMAVAAPAEKPHTTTSVAKHHSDTKHRPHTTTTHHHTTTPHHAKPKKPTTKAHKSSTTKAHKPKKTTAKVHTTKAHKSSTTKAHKPKKTTAKVHTTKVHTTTTLVPPTTTTTPSSKPTTSPKPKPGKVGQTGTIVDQNDFCIFLPPTYGGDIAANEDRAIAFCTKANMPNAPGAKVLPKGFIKSAHFTRNTAAGWVQITGRINRGKYGLSPKDGGGQYDMRAPVGATYSGYNAFVQLTEPDSEIYCIRACMTKADCPVNKSTHGCVRVLGGDYS